MPNIVWEILATAVIAFAANLCGQAMRQASEPGKAPAAILLSIAVLAIGLLVAWFVDQVKSTSDYVVWAIAACFGFFFGWREKS